MSVSIINNTGFLKIVYSTGKYSYVDKPFTISTDDEKKKIGIRSKFFADQFNYADVLLPVSTDIDDLITQLLGYLDTSYQIVQSVSVIEQIQQTGFFNGKEAKVFHILGRRASFTSTTLFNDVGEGIGSASAELFPVLNGTETIQVISSSASDKNGGTGANSVKITYIDTNYDIQQTASINMNGITAVQIMVGGMLQFLWGEVDSVGSNKTSVGNVTFRTSGLTTLSRITAGGNKSMDAIFMVPDDYEAYVYAWSGSSIQNAQDLRLRATVDSYTRELSSVYHFVDNRNTPSNSSFEHDLKSLKFPARCLIKVSTISSSQTAQTRCDCDFLVVIIKI